MQMIHLFIADVLWIAVMVMALEAGSVSVRGELTSPKISGRAQGVLQTKSIGH
jgi:hypothetical protein